MAVALPRSWLPVVLLISTGATAADSSERVHRYHVQVSPDAAQLAVLACFDGSTPPGLRAGDDEAATLLLDPSLLDGSAPLPLAVSDGRIMIEALDIDACVQYGVDFDRARPQRRFSGVRRIGHSVMASSGLWLWRPDPSVPGDDIEVTIDLPPGLGVSLPWRVQTQSPSCSEPPAHGSPGVRLTFRAGRVPPSWPDLVAFGPLAEVPIELAGAELRVAVLHTEAPANPVAVQRWLSEAAQAVTTLYGRFPQANLQVLVVPVAAQAEAVPWGEVLRGGAPAVLFVIDPGHSTEEFRADWTAVHEFSHLLLPYVSRSEPWISEGFASYYQNILRARAGLIEAPEAWLKLWSGFQRGMAATDGRSTLARAARQMQHDNLMRVYWAGAAVALIADTELREQTGNRQSLDTALDLLNRCCMSPERRWSGRELFAQLDALTDSSVFSAIFTRESQATRFPDVASAYRRLGIRVSGNRIIVDDEAPQSSIRQALTSPPAQATVAAAGKRARLLPGPVSRPCRSSSADRPAAEAAARMTSVCHNQLRRTHNQRQQPVSTSCSR